MFEPAINLLVLLSTLSIAAERLANVNMLEPSRALGQSVSTPFSSLPPSCLPVVLYVHAIRTRGSAAVRRLRREPGCLLAGGDVPLAADRRVGGAEAGGNAGQPQER